MFVFNWIYPKDRPPKTPGLAKRKIQNAPQESPKTQATAVMLLMDGQHTCWSPGPVRFIGLEQGRHGRSPWAIHSRERRLCEGGKAAAGSIESNPLHCSAGGTSSLVGLQLPVTHDQKIPPHATRSTQRFIKSFGQIWKDGGMRNGFPLARRLAGCETQTVTYQANFLR